MFVAMMTADDSRCRSDPFEPHCFALTAFKTETAIDINDVHRANDIGCFVPNDD